ncbi:cytochrome c oxidase subunit II [Calothrix sp. NIES-3974]|uniref:cytochrome c oxidase subunit II n=1 Tax=Calothrix sp. NIES-3974 TaxID=2005462 RepID=UPI000B5DC599|nr:cytochrome c oxidase subunit II [Calothrix sp. NIES-3974]BAZ04230.1 cytochrome c oxidase subunit II [Calothrix sp. NIES-3974]
MQQVPISLITLIAGVLIGAVSLWTGQQTEVLFPVQASEQAPLVDNFYSIMLTIGTALLLIVQGAIVISLFKFRRRRGDNGDGLPIEGNFALEVFWTAIPALIVIALGIYSVDIFQQMGGFSAGQSNHLAYHSNHAIAATLTPDRNQKLDKIGLGGNSNHSHKPVDLEVNVTGMQFAWIFNYPDAEITSGDLHVPIGADVKLNLVATDVIHSFWIPQFRIKQDVIPGQPTELRFVATKTGTYPVVCAELCGGYHGSMRTQVIVHTPEEFQDWLTTNQVAENNSSSVDI